MLFVCASNPGWDWGSQKQDRRKEMKMDSKDNLIRSKSLRKTIVLLLRWKKTNDQRNR